MFERRRDTYSAKEPLQNFAPSGKRLELLSRPFRFDAEQHLFEMPFEKWAAIDRSSLPGWKCSIRSPVRFSDLPPTSSGSSSSPIAANKIRLYNGPVLNLEVDAIVNAANTTCLGGGGVDGAIHRAAGSLLLRECATFPGCATGQCRITKGYYLPARFVLHTVGPVGERPKDLASCYRSCLKMCQRHRLRSVGFCCISTGVYGYPLAAATRVALTTAIGLLRTPTIAAAIDEIVFACFQPAEYRCYTKELEKM